VHGGLRGRPGLHRARSHARCRLRQCRRQRTNAQTPASDIATFWRGFNDPALSQLVERALAASGDVRIAQARLQEARATLQGAQAERLPNVGVNADVVHSLAPEVQIPGTSRSLRTSTVYDAGFTANWELDFFGRNRRASESAAAQVDASEAGVHAAHTAVAAEVARNYSSCAGCSSATRSRASRSSTSAMRCG
jgi:multidrug efflux system outer membrane protein